MLEAAIVRHQCFVVERSGASMIAVFTEYRFNGEMRQHIQVLRTTHTLFPRDKLALRIECEAYDVPFSGVRKWLQEKGFGILGETTRPAP